MKNFLINLVLFVFFFFSGLNKADAVIQGWVPPEDYAEGDSFDIGSEPLNDMEEMDQQDKEMSMEDIFGSEQVFPFPHGLGN